MFRSVAVRAVVLLSLVASEAAAQRLPTAESRGTYGEMLNEARRRNDVPAQALAALQLALSEMAAGDQRSARAHLKESSDLFAATGDHFGAWLALFPLAELQKNAADYDGAVATYATAVDVLARAAAPGATFSLGNLEAVGRAFGMEALPLQSAALPAEIVKPILLLFADVVTRDGYGAALLEAGEVDRAEAELMKAQQGSSLFGGFFDASLAAHIGDLRRRQWRFEEARAAYAKALNGVDMLPLFVTRDDTLRIRILGQLADIEMLGGRTAEAVRWNDRALALARQAGNRRREASLLEERGNLFWRGGRFEAAEATLEEALTLAHAADAFGVQAGVLRQLGVLHMMRGKYGTAASYLEKAIAAFQKSADTAGESHTWALLADVYVILDLRGAAKLASEKATVLAQQSGMRAAILGADLTAAAHRFFAGETPVAELNAAISRAWSSPEARSMLMVESHALSQLACELTAGTLPAPLSVPQELAAVAGSIGALLEGHALIEQRNLAAARGALVRGLAENPSGDFAPAFLSLIGTAWALEGNLDEAADAFTEAAELLDTTIDDMRVEEMLSGYLASGRGVYFDLLIDLLLRQGRAVEAFEVSERSRARAFLRLVGNTPLDPARGADVQLVREAEALRIELAGGGRDTTDLREMRSRYEALMTRIKTTSPEYASLTSVTALKLEDIRRELSPETTLVSYYATAGDLHAWVVDRHHTHHVRLGSGAAAVAEATCWSDSIGLRRGVALVNRERRCRPDVTAEEVHRALFAPLRRHIQTRRLMIVAHGPLHYVPFAALRNADTGRYLIEDYTIVYAPSGSTLPFLRAKETPVAGEAVVFGDPATGGQADLPHAAREAMRVAETLGCAPLLGAEAMESRLYDLRREVDLVHIAAHGVYEPDHPLFSRIALAPGGGRDGNLEVHEILGELDLSGVNLVVLAACDSGVGKRGGGDDIVGLTRALLYAGSPGVVASSWKVRDDATAALMEEFYCGLLAGETAAEALRTAQLILLRGGAFTAPRDWAAFAVYGDPAGRWGRAASTRSPQAGQ